MSATVHAVAEKKSKPVTETLLNPGVQPIFETGLMQEDEASPEVHELYEDIKKTMGAPFVPNFFKTQAAVDERIVRATWGVVKGVLCEGKLGRTLNEKILTAISRARSCHYCESAHLAFCKMIGVSDETLHQLSGRWDEMPAGKEKDIIRFAVKCGTDPDSLKYDDYQVLRNHGMTDNDIAWVVAMCAFSTYVNTIASGMKVPTDDAFNKALNRPLGTP